MGYWIVERTGDRIDDLGYRNSSYILRINGKVFKFPTQDEALEYIDEMFGDSGE